jgi:hypothetical protein
MNNVTRLEREIAKTLGVTPNMLDVLRRLNRGDPISGNNAGTALDARGLTTRNPADGPGWGYRRVLTDAGRELLARARAMGF